MNDEVLSVNNHEVSSMTLKQVQGIIDVSVKRGQIELKIRRRPDEGNVKFRHLKNCCNYPKIGTIWLYHREMSPKHADRIANSLPRPVCPKTRDHYGNTVNFLNIRTRATEILKSKSVRSTDDVIGTPQIVTKINDSSFSSKSVSEIDYFSNSL